jgi:hypothetical protein
MSDLLPMRPDSNENDARYAELTEALGLLKQMVRTCAGFA